jgi:hypothetical protein
MRLFGSPFESLITVACTYMSSRWWCITGRGGVCVKDFGGYSCPGMGNGDEHDGFANMVVFSLAIRRECAPLAWIYV